MSGKQVVKTDNVPGILAVMATAGLYDDSGKWLYTTGLPAKSGVDHTGYRAYSRRALQSVNFEMNSATARPGR